MPAAARQFALEAPKSTKTCGSGGCGAISDVEGTVAEVKENDGQAHGMLEGEI